MNETKEDPVARASRLGKAGRSQSASSKTPGSPHSTIDQAHLIAQNESERKGEGERILDSGNGEEGGMIPSTHPVYVLAR